MSEHDETFRENEPIERETDRRLRDLFASASPAEDFEDQVITGFRHRTTRRHLRIHPVLLQAAASAAAVLVLGTIGYVGSQHIDSMSAAQPHVRAASNLRQIGQAILNYHNDAGENAPHTYAIRDLAGDGDINPAATQPAPGFFMESSAPDAPASPRQEENLGTRQQYIRYSFDSAIQDAHKAARNNDFSNSQDALNRAGVAVNTDPSVFSPDEVRKMNGTLAQTRTQVAQREAAFNEASAQRQGQEAQNRLNSRLSQEAMSRRETVHSLVKTARQYVEQGKYTEALTVVDQILTVDPGNDYAVGVKPLIENRALFAQQRKYKEAFDGNLTRQLNEDDEKKIARSDVLRYPENWPDLSEQRGKEKTVVAERGRLAADQATSAQLDRVLPEINFQATPFADVVDYMRDVLQANIYVNWKALEAAGIDRNATVTLKLEHARVSNALQQILAQLGTDVHLGAIVTDGIVTISTEDDLKNYAKDQPASQPTEEAPAPATAPIVSPSAQSSPEPMNDADPTGRKIIRHGEMEFEVESFDGAFNRIAAAVKEEGGFIAGSESEKLANGKVRGSVTARLPPENLDRLVLKMRSLGDLKRQRISSEEVTKQYLATQSELGAAKSMEQRLIELSKTPNGGVKNLLETEKELGTVRERIQKAQEQLKYYDNRMLLSTLQLSLVEKDIQQAASLTETETADTGVETEDVEKARAEAIKAIDEAKGRIVESQLKQFDAGQLNGRVVAEVAPERAGQVIDRIKQLGKVARLDVQRQTVTSNGSSAPTTATNVAGPAPRVERRETRIVASFYNLANLSPRTTTSVSLACDDLEKTYRAIIARTLKADGGRVVSSNINRGADQQGGASVTVEVKSADADAVLNDVKASGEVMRVETTENTDTANVTTAKRALVVQLVPFASAPPRQVTTRNLAVSDVAKSFNALLDAAHKANARVVVSKLEQNSGQPTSAWLDIELRRESAPAIDAAIGAAGDVVGGSVAVAPDQPATLESKVQYKLGLAPADQLPPRERTALTIENRDVESAAAAMAHATASAGGRVIDSNVAKEPSGRTIARLVLDVPLDKSTGIVDRARESGVVRVSQTSKNASVPAGALARARVELTLVSPEAIVQEGRGVWSTLRNGLATSAAGLMWSLQLIVIGLCLVAPWALLIWAGWRLIRRWRGREVAPA